MPTSPDNGWIDVRDLGEAHVRCLEREQAHNERIVPCAGAFKPPSHIRGTPVKPRLGSYLWKEWYDVVRKVAPSVLPTDKAAELVSRFPSPVVGEVQHKVKYDTSKAQRILGMETYRTKDETAGETLEKAVREGWLFT